MLLRQYAIKRWFVILLFLTNVSALLGETRTPEIVSFQSCGIPCLKNDTALAGYIFDTHHLSISCPLSPPAWRRTAQCSPVLRQQRTPSGMRRTLAKSRRSGAMSHFFALLGAYRRDHSVSWLATLQWTLFRPRRRRCRQHVLGTSEAAAAVSFSRHGIHHDWEDSISGVHVFPGSAETWTRRGGITNHRLIAYSLSNTSAKNYKNRLTCVEVILYNISVVFWDTV